MERKYDLDVYDRMQTMKATKMTNKREINATCNTPPTQAAQNTSGTDQCESNPAQQ
jgi:hypothetical protein